MNILYLKILQVFFKNRGEILVFEKMLNFLSFLVLYPFQVVFDFATESSFRNPIDVLATKLRFGNEMQVLEPKSDQIG